MTYITTHNDHIIGIHQSQMEANANVLIQKDENGELAVLNILNVELPLHAETGWYCNTDGSVIQQFPPNQRTITKNDYTEAMRTHLSMIDAIMRSSTRTISMERLVNDINPTHRKWMLVALENTMNHSNRQRVREISTLITNLFFSVDSTTNDFCGNVETVVSYTPVDTITSLTQSELDVRIASIRTAINLTRTNTKKWIDLDNVSIENAIRSADATAFPTTPQE